MANQKAKIVQAVKYRKAKHPLDDSLRRTLTVPEVASILGISRSSAFEAAKSGQLPTIRLGTRLLIPKAALEKLLEAGTA
jgi:excisionase family DNA binding protein